MDNQMKNFMEIIRYAIHNNSGDELPNLLEPVDWDELENIFRQHNLFAIFHEVASKFPEYKKLPRYNENACFMLLMVGQQIKRTDEFLQLYQDFLKEDLHPIVMKGIICRQLYGKSAEQRPSGDEDIYVRKDEFFKVKDVLEARGYVCEFEEVTEAQLDVLQEITFSEKESGLVIEVHTNVMGHDNEMRTQMGKYFCDAFERMRTVAIRGVSLATMSHTDHFLYLILHAFRHFAASGVGIRQMLDILLYHETFGSEIDWETVKEVLKVNHALEYYGDLQAIGMQYWNFKFEVLFNTCSPEELLEDMLSLGVFGKGDVTDALAGRINVSTMDQKNSRIRILLRAGFPSVDFFVNDAPYLKEKPWMLPVEWIKRWGRFLEKAKNYEGNLMLEGLQKSTKRRKLLGKYGL